MEKYKNSGFSLMEVLVSMVVIAVGLLGYLSLQLTSINSNQEGMARSQANLIAQDLAAAIRANRAYINQGDGTANVGNAYINGDYNNCDTAPVASCTGAAANCTDKEQALFDIYRVCRSKLGFDTANANSDLLIDGGRLYVACDDREADSDSCSPGSTLSIFTYWQASALREDVGQGDIIRNQRCANFANDPGANYDCIILDIMP